jgi:undecaprenyl diphosphate synthase
MHVAIIMHGNSQWAIQRRLPSTAARAAGVAALRSTVALAAVAGVRTLTLYCNCGPGGAAVADLCVLRYFLRGNLPSGPKERVRISLIGNSKPLSWFLPRSLERNEHLGVVGTGLHVRIVVDYSAHDHLTRTAWRSGDSHEPEQFFRQLREIDPTALPAGAVDLLIRTGRGVCRSDFMLWEVAYANLYLVDRLWPDFTACDFRQALNSRSSRNDLVVTH